MPKLYDARQFSGLQTTLLRQYLSHAVLDSMSSCKYGPYHSSVENREVRELFYGVKS